MSLPAGRLTRCHRRRLRDSSPPRIAESTRVTTDRTSAKVAVRTALSRRGATAFSVASNAFQSSPLSSAMAAPYPRIGTPYTRLP